MPKAQTPTDVLRIHEGQDGERQVILHPSDDDLFVRTGKQVIEACRLGISIELWLREFQAMLDEVARWAVERAGRIYSCYCSPVGPRVVFFFAPTSGQYNFDLADELADLNLMLLQKFNVGMVEVHQVPWNEFDRFLNVGQARWIHGAKCESPRPVEA